MPVFVASMTGYLVYVAAKESFLASRQDIYNANDLLGERNLIYLSPIVFAATAIWAERRRINAWALAGATAVLVASFAWIPYVFDAASAPHSPAVASISHIAGGLSHPTMRGALIVATILAALVLLLRRAVVFAAVAVVVVGWSLTGEVNASNKSIDVGRNLIASQPRPLDWIDRATHGAPAVYVGQAKLRGPEILSLGFWNNSLGRMVTLGGETVYGLVFETKIASADGRLSDPRRADYVVSDEEVEVAGQRRRAQEALEPRAGRRACARRRLRGRDLAGRLDGGVERIYALRPRRRPGGPNADRPVAEVRVRSGVTPTGDDPGRGARTAARNLGAARRAPRVPGASR